MKIEREIQENEHRERRAMYAAEIEATRRELAALEAEPAIEHPGRRLLQWAMPAAATVLVAFVAILALGADDAGARTSTSPDALASQAAELDPTDVGPEVAPVAVEVEPEPIAVAPEPEQPKPIHTQHPRKPPKTPKGPPLIIVDPNGDPLG
jgi:hypothetical protein